MKNHNTAWYFLPLLFANNGLKSIKVRVSKCDGRWNIFSVLSAAFISHCTRDSKQAPNLHLKDQKTIQILLVLKSIYLRFLLWFSVQLKGKTLLYSARKALSKMDCGFHINRALLSCRHLENSHILSCCLWRITLLTPPSIHYVLCLYPASGKFTLFFNLITILPHPCYIDRVVVYCKVQIYSHLSAKCPQSGSPNRCSR